MSQEQAIKFTLRLANRRNEAQPIILEPWTGKYTLGSGKVFDIVAEGTPDTPLIIEFNQDDVTIYSFDSKGARLTIFEGGRKLRSE